MSFDTIKNGIALRLKGLGYQESKQPFEFAGASQNEYGNTFILTCDAGEAREAESQRITSSLYDYQAWTLKVAFATSGNNDVIVRDDIQRKREAILSDLDDPDNWQGFARYLRYSSWETIKEDDYVVLVVILEVTDDITY